MLGGGDEQQLVDQAAEAPALVEGRAEQPVEAGVVQAAAEATDRRDGGQHARERGPQLVGHGGDELALLEVEVQLPSERLLHEGASPVGPFI